MFRNILIALTLFFCGCDNGQPKVGVNKNKNEESPFNPQPRTSTSSTHSFDEKSAQEFLKKAVSYVKQFFPDQQNVSEPEMCFDYSRVRSISPEPPLGKMFFDQQTGKNAIFINKNIDEKLLKPMVVHEVAHYFQAFVESVVEFHSYKLTDYFFARNIIREGQADFIAEKWSIENKIEFETRDVNQSVKKYLKNLYPGNFFRNFYYAFGYEYFKQLSEKFDQRAFIKKSLELFKDKHLSTTNLLNEYLGIKMKDFFDFNKMQAIMKSTFAKPADVLTYQGAASFLFYLMSTNLEFAEASDLLKKVTKISSIYDVDSDLILTIIEINIVKEIIKQFANIFNMIKQFKVGDFEVQIFQYKFNETKLSLIFNSDNLIIIQENEGIEDEAVIRKLLNFLR